MSRWKCKIASGREAAAPDRPLRRPAHGAEVTIASARGSWTGRTARPGQLPAKARRTASGRWRAADDQGAQPWCGGLSAGARRRACGSARSLPGVKQQHRADRSSGRRTAAEVTVEPSGTCDHGGAR